MSNTKIQKIKKEFKPNTGGGNLCILTDVPCWAALQLSSPLLPVHCQGAHDGDGDGDGHAHADATSCTQPRCSCS